MSGLLRRLVDVAKSYMSTGHHESRSVKSEDYFYGDKASHESPGQNAGERTGNTDGQSSGTTYEGIPPQVVKDLAVFNLTPPSSLKAVKNARNREIKKYHSDKFINDPDKLETSKEIMQIYNAAYDRLNAYYQE